MPVPKQPDCGSNSCRYAKTRTGMRTNSNCTCDRCPSCLAYLRPGGPGQHHDLCTQPTWAPEHHRGIDN